MNVVLFEQAQSGIPNGNVVDMSMIKEIDCRLPFQNFSIKYVAHGSEMYQIHQSRYVLEKGSYLLANQHAEGSVIIDSREPVCGICINVSLALLAEVIGDLQKPGAPVEEIPMQTFFSSEAFLDNQYRASETAVGALLSELESGLYRPNHPPRTIDKAFFYQLAERLILDHRPIVKQLQRVPSVKLNTKKDLFRRLQTGKAVMDTHFLEIPDIAWVAKASGLSEYHFFRLFRSVFAESPYRYVLKKRLEFAAGLMKKRHMSLTDIALDAGFSDIHSFSKSYKKYFGRAPSKHQNTPGVEGCG